MTDKDGGEFNKVTKSAAHFSDNNLPNPPDVIHQCTCISTKDQRLIASNQGLGKSALVQSQSESHIIILMHNFAQFES